MNTIAVVDRRERPLRALRVSLSEHEASGPTPGVLPADARLTREEIVRLVHILADLGVRRVHFTGLRPRDRRDVPQLLTELASIAGLEMSVITSGPLPAAEVRALAGTGLVRLTTDLDTLAEVGALGWRPEDLDSSGEHVAWIAPAMGLEAGSPATHEALARRGAESEGKWPIRSVREPLCEGCPRARLSAGGVLSTCHFAPGGWDLRTPLRQGWDDRTIAGLVCRVWQGRRDRYSDGPRPAGTQSPVVTPISCG